MTPKSCFLMSVPLGSSSFSPVLASGIHMQVQSLQECGLATASHAEHDADNRLFADCARRQSWPRWRSLLPCRALAVALCASSLHHGCHKGEKNLSHCDTPHLHWWKKKNRA
jgi:hypothetical protein